MTLEFHPIANCWRLIEGERFTELVDDIRTNGLREPIVLFEDKILDGRNRYRACREAGVEPRFVAYGDPDDPRIDWQRWETEYDIREERGTLRIEIAPETEEFESEEIEAEFLGGLSDPIAFAKSANEMRRHDEPNQRAITAAKLANLRKGGNAGVTKVNAAVAALVTQEQAAAMMDVSRESVQRARVVIEKGAPELVDAVERGEVSLSAGGEIARLAEPHQKAIVGRGGEEAAKEAARLREERREQAKKIAPARSPEEQRERDEWEARQKDAICYRDLVFKSAMNITSLMTGIYTAKKVLDEMWGFDDFKHGVGADRWERLAEIAREFADEERARASSRDSVE